MSKPEVKPAPVESSQIRHELYRLPGDATFTTSAPPGSRAVVLAKRFHADKHGVPYDSLNGMKFSEEDDGSILVMVVG